MQTTKPNRPMKTVQFSNVGRDRVTWEVDIRTPTPRNILRAVKAAGVLMSRNLAIDMTRGTIYAGIRPVGRFYIMDKAYTSST
jgi:hypothetical protein